MTDLKRQERKTARIKAWGPRFDHQTFSQDFGLDDLLGYAFFRHAMGQRVIKHSNFIKLTVTAEMIGMGVGVDNHHRFISYRFYGLTPGQERRMERRAIRWGGG